MAADESLETPRLRGTRVAPDDFAAYFALYQDPRVTATLTVDGQPLSEAETRERFGRKLALWREHGYGLWFFRDRAGGHFVGYCGLQPAEGWDPPTVELLYATLPAAWSQGLTSEMAAAVLHVGFTQLNLPEVVSYTLPANRASQRVMEKQGLRYERDITHVGLPHRFYRLTRDEWREGRGEPKDGVAAKTPRTPRRDEG
jgi:RimJ/RimL family protein N-acetyltransferase